MNQQTTPQSVLNISPMTLFEDTTYLGEGAQAEYWKREIERRCFQENFIPVIEYAPGLGWVFHTLFPPDGTVSKKEISKQFEQEKPIGAEKELEDEVCQLLSKTGQTPRRQVRLHSGIADIVTETAVYELKDRLTRASLFEAIGQVLVYRQEINPNLNAVIVARPGENVRPIISMAYELGIEVWEWNKK